MKAMAFVVIVVLVGAVMLGGPLAEIDLLNPITARSKAEDRAMWRKIERQRQERQLERERAEEQLEMQRRRQDLETRGQRSELVTDLLAFVGGVGAGCLLVLSLAAAYYLVNQAPPVQVTYPAPPGGRPGRRTPLASVAAPPFGPESGSSKAVDEARVL